MMKWSFRVATILGTEVRIHATFGLLLAYAAYLTRNEGGDWAVALLSMGVVCILFVCVLLHEFGHILAARRYGIHTPDVTLLPIGGMARLERMPREPIQELVVAICGPLVNVIIALALTPFISAPLPTTLEELLHPQTELEMLRTWNLCMVIFNLLPAFPMDGGRVLRALLHATLGNYQRATDIAATLGQALAITLPVGMYLAGKDVGPMKVFLAMFIFFVARSEAAHVRHEETFRNLSVKDGMMTNFTTLSTHATLHEAVEALLAGSQHDFPILDPHGSLAGMLYRRQMFHAVRQSEPTALLHTIMQPCWAQVRTTDDLGSVLAELHQHQVTALPVMNPQGQLVGLLTTENVTEMLMIRASLEARRDSH
jgi:Zn-dependent protease